MIKIEERKYKEIILKEYGILLPLKDNTKSFGSLLTKQVFAYILNNLCKLGYVISKKDFDVIDTHSYEYISHMAEIYNNLLTNDDIYLSIEDSEVYLNRYKASYLNESYGFPIYDGKIPGENKDTTEIIFLDEQSISEKIDNIEVNTKEDVQKMIYLYNRIIQFNTFCIDEQFNITEACIIAAALLDEDSSIILDVLKRNQGNGLAVDLILTAIVFISDGEYTIKNTLNNKIELKSIPNYIRKNIMISLQYLSANMVQSGFDSFNVYRKHWKLVAKYLHPFSFKDEEFINIKDIFKTILNNEKIDIVEKYIEGTDISISRLLRDGEYFANNMEKIIIYNPYVFDIYLSLFMRLEVSYETILRLIAYFSSYNDNKIKAYIKNGKVCIVDKSYIIEDESEVDKLENLVSSLIIKAIDVYRKNNPNTDDNNKSVYIDEKYKHIYIAYTDSGVYYQSTGSAIEVPDIDSDFYYIGLDKEFNQLTRSVSISGLNGVNCYLYITEEGDSLMIHGIIIDDRLYTICEPIIAASDENKFVKLTNEEIHDIFKYVIYRQSITMTYYISKVIEARAKYQTLAETAEEADIVID